MKIKTIAAIVLAAGMCLSMTACGEKEDDYEANINKVVDEMSEDEIEKAIEEKFN